VGLSWAAAQHRLQATRLRRRQAEGKRAPTGLLSQGLRRTRRAPEPYRWAARRGRKNGDVERLGAGDS